MSTWVWIVIAVVAVVVVLGIVWSGLRAKRTRGLQDTFGQEYDRTVDEAGGRRSAERELRDRQKQHDELDIKPLSPESRDRYARRWQSTQARFVDDPRGAVDAFRIAYYFDPDALRSASDLLEATRALKAKGG